MKDDVVATKQVTEIAVNAEWYLDAETVREDAKSQGLTLDTMTEDELRAFVMDNYSDSLDCSGGGDCLNFDIGVDREN